jgi:hypothetical protein
LPALINHYSVNTQVNHVFREKTESPQ